jgi:hypothetical protein
MYICIMNCNDFHKLYCGKLNYSFKIYFNAVITSYIHIKKSLHKNSSKGSKNFLQILDG